MGHSLEGLVCGNIGVGAVGAYTVRLQKLEGADILVYDVNEQRALQVAEEYGAVAVPLDELLAASDWISTAILPLPQVPAVMSGIGERRHLLKPGALLMDHSGVKTGKADLLDVLMKTGETFTGSMRAAIEGREDVEAIAIHFGFRPDVELEGQNVYISPVQPEDGGLWLPKVTTLLKDYGAHVFRMTPEQQDMVTLRHQMIPWMALFASMDAIRRSGSDMGLAEIEQMATKLSGPFVDLMKRMVSGNPGVYAGTMFHHPFAGQAAALLKESIEQLAGQLVNGAETQHLFEDKYKHLAQFAASGSPEKTTGKPVMVELYYVYEDYGALKKALRLDAMVSNSFHSPVSVSMIDGGRINELHRAKLPVARYVTHAYRDRDRQPEIAFHVRNVSHPEHPEVDGMRFSSTIPKELERAQQLKPEYWRIQLQPLHQDPIVNFFRNVQADPALSGLGPFVVSKAL
jgi:prephenate dehydrogenase